MSDTRKWEYDDDGYYGTECGDAFEFEIGGVIHNSFRFCPYCGKKITVRGEQS